MPRVKNEQSSGPSAKLSSSAPARSFMPSSPTKLGQSPQADDLRKYLDGLAGHQPLNTESSASESEVPEELRYIEGFDWVNPHFEFSPKTSPTKVSQKTAVENAAQNQTSASTSSTPMKRSLFK